MLWFVGWTPKEWHVRAGHWDTTIVWYLRAPGVKWNFILSNAFPRSVVVWPCGDAIPYGRSPDLAFRRRHHATGSAAHENSRRYGVRYAVRAPVVERACVVASRV